MQQVLHTGKRVFSAAIAAATIAFSIGAAALVSPVSAQAADGGDLIKGTSLSTVYYMGHDGLRYAFPNEKTYFSWHADFDDVMTISDTELASYTLGGNIVVRPGTHFVKVTSDAKAYAVGRDGMLHWMETEEVATDLAGSDWASNIIDIPDVFFDDYTVGTSLMSATAFEGAVYEMGGTTYISWDGEMLELTDDGMDDNAIWAQFVLDGDNIDDSALVMGDAIDGEVTSLVDNAQTEDDVVVADGDVNVSASSSTPAGVSLPGRTNAVEVFSFDLEAGSDDTTVDAITLTMIGAGATSNINSVYLYEGETRLTEARSVNAATRQVTFSNLGLAIDGNDERTITARIEVAVAQTASDTIGFEISSAEDIETAGDVDGSFPVSGNIFTMTGSDAGWLEVDKTGTITNPTLGEQDAVVGQFKITTNSEAASIQTVTLKLDNASDHSDFQLWDGSTWLASGTNTSGDLVLFDLSDASFEIEEGSSDIFSVSADISGQDAENVKVFVDNRVDIVAEGGDFGFGMCVDTGSTSCTSSAAVGSYDGTTCTSSSGNCSFSTVQGGELTIVSNGPSTSDIAVNGKDEVLMNFSITAAQDVTIKDLDFIVYGDDDSDNDPFDSTDDGTDSDTDGLVTGTESSVLDIKVINTDTGAVVTGPLELDNATDDDEQTIDFTDDFTIDGGETLNLAITVDIDNSVGTGTEFGATLDISGLSVEDVNGDTLTLATDVVPTGDLIGSPQQALSSSLVIALASTPGDVTTVDGTSNVHVQSFSMVAGQGGDVLVSSIELSAYADEDGSGTFTLGDVSGADVNDFVQSCTLKDGNDVVLDGPESAIANGTVLNFNDVDWTIEAGESVIVKVICNFNNPSDTTDDNFFAFDLDDVSEDVVAEDEDGNDVDPTSDDPNGGTSPTNIVSVNDAGTLAVAVDSSTPAADYILTNTSDNRVASYRFTATNEAFDIDVLSFTEEEAEDDTGTTDSTAYANNIAEVTIVYPKADGTEGTKSVTMVGNEANFSALDMYVEVGTPAIVDVYVDVPKTDRDAGGQAQSNEEVRLAFSDGNDSGTDDFKAVGAGSDTTLGEDASGIADLGASPFSTDGVATFVVRETKPTISLHSLSPTGSKVPGDQEVYRFNVAANSNEDVIMKQVIFTISASDNASTNWENCDTDGTASALLEATDYDFYGMSELGTSTALDVDADWTGMTATGADCTTTSTDLAYIRMSLATAEVIPAGQTYNYSFWIDLTGASALNDDNIQVSLASDPIIAAASFLAADDLGENDLSATDTTLTMGAASTYALGDILCMDTGDDNCTSADELMLVVVDGGATLDVVRGYLNTPITTATTNDIDDDVDRMPGAFLWQDDGTTALDSSNEQEEYFGAYLVDSLPVTGNSLVF